MNAAGFLFLALSLILFGGGTAAGYETWAVLTGHKTISNITASAIQKSPALAFVSSGIFLFAAGALVTHFTQWNSL